MEDLTKKRKSKELKFKHNCKICKQDFMSADVRGVVCQECKKPKECACGCGKLSKSARGKYAVGCHSRGKTYLEIYGTDNPTNGFKKGALNPMADLDIVEKVRQGVLASYTPELREIRRQAKLEQLDSGFVYGKMLHINERGEKFRSQLEVDFANYLHSCNIPYEYEPKPIKLNENIYGYKRKVPDFKIGNILIEITGLAYNKWIEEFKIKIKLLREVTDQPLIIVTYPDKIHHIQEFENTKTIIIHTQEVQEKLPLALEILKSI